MSDSRKGKEYRFGMKAQRGADAASGPVRTLLTTPANVHDIKQALALLYGEEKQVCGEAGYWGIGK